MLKGIILFLIAAYQRFLSPLFGSSCRFYPSCSVYAKEAVEKKGVWRGFVLTAGRLLRCQPFHPGGIDYVK